MLTVLLALIVVGSLWALFRRRDHVIELDESDLLVGPPLPVYARSSSLVRSRRA